MRKLIFVVMIIFSFLNVSAQQVHSSEVIQIAQTFLRGLHSDRTDFQLSLQHIEKCHDNSPAWYLITSNNGDFVIISADKRAFPIIGYGKHFILSETSVLPPAFQYWMEQRTREIEYIREHNLPADHNITETWNKLLDGTYDFTELKTRNVTPLLVSTWNQDCWYNEMCPEDAAGPCGHVYAGCVATAMGQVMYYWRFPITGQGSKSYNAYPYGTLTANFGATTYKWHEMIGNINTSYPELARLLYHCGVSVEMAYSPQGSGSNTWSVPGALKNYFRYASANYRLRQTYSDANWMAMLRDNLDNKQPVIYSGSGPQGGHAFICDGYQGTDYFHFDWGWSGLFNGYYYLNNLNPGGNLFNTMQAAVMDIYPPTTGYPYTCGQTTLTAVSGSFDDGSGPKYNYQPNAHCSWLIKPSIPVDYIRLTFIYFQLGDGDTVKVYGGETSASPLLGAYTGSNLPQQIQSNTQALFVEFTSNNSDEQNGFLAEYISYPTKFCSSTVTITNYSGIIEDGSGPYPYAPNSNCRWDLQPPGANKFTITFLEFNTEPVNDKVRILDLTNNSVIAEFSGYSLPDPVVVNTNRLRIHFLSNSAHQGDGWKLQYDITTDMTEHTIHFIGLYPNPATDRITIEGLQQEAAVSVLDLHGKSLLNAYVTKEYPYIDLSSLSSGIYFARIVSGSECLTLKFIKE